jgi:enoyl-CoA hydratase
MAGEVIARTEGRLGRLTLNRPAALHALTARMCADMLAALVSWRDDDAIAAIVIDHAPGTRGFCAGGDIRMLAESGAGDGVAAREFFHTEYRLNHLLKAYPKPVIALIDGITMGGGVGISVHGAYRVATERTVFAMPETGIGLFPDVGGGWFLPRLPGEVGVWLALTGARLKAADCVAAGVATHFVQSARLGDLVAELSAPSFLVGEGREGARAEGAQTAPPRSTFIAPSPLPSPDEGEAHVLARFAGDPGSLVELTAENRARIDRLFAHGSVEEIVAALAQDGSDWARAQLDALQTKSPQTMKVALRQIREGAKFKSFADNMRIEYRIACRVVRRHDFLEGVRALIVEKDNQPKWRPDTLEGVTDAMLDEIFAPLPPAEEWTPLV